MAIQQLNLPAIYSAAQQNKLLDTKNALAQNELANAQAYNALAPQIAQGDYGAYQKGLAVAPEKSSALWKNFSAEDNARREQVARLVGSVLQAPPDQRPAAWQKAREMAAQIPGMDLSNVPQQYDEQTAKLIYARATDPKAIGPLSGPGKVQADINAGYLPPGTPLRGTGVTVNLPGQPQIGKIPPGYAAIQDPKTGEWSMKPIAGGPAATKASEEAAANAENNKQILENAQLVKEDIGRAISSIESAPVPVTGVGSVLQYMPGTTAKDTAALIDTIKANIGFDKLQRMRKMSPTGGALGQVSEIENRLLQATQGNLDLAQSKDQLVYNLKRLEVLYGAMVNGLQDQQGNIINPNTDPQKWAQQFSAAEQAAGVPQGALPSPQSGSGSAQQYSEGQTATNPQTGEKLIYRNGSWQPMQ